MKQPVLMDEKQQEAARKQLPPSQLLGPVGVALAAVGGIMLTVMMALTVFDVIGRYVFNSPIKGAAELTELLLAATIFLGLGAVSLREEHVTVDLVTDRLPAFIQPWRIALSGLFSGVVLALVSWRLWVYAAQIGSYGGSTTNLAIPIAPLGYFCAICAAIGAIITAFLPMKRLYLRLMA
ncbi:TRAP transporter small permease [Celeribacter litoreus]|uniref:TRAP transporter small permease n=1 Tax=Celeribacter litoreus TaxID=2876714 RepID=UPI001CC9C2AC|nr:TRAP transporter small permease [Celeribacter litoreus]MCA0043936.1 TRAP transporter small permease [Celeribacter litoreus]